MLRRRKQLPDVRGDGRDAPRHSHLPHWAVGLRGCLQLRTSMAGAPEHRRRHVRRSRPGGSGISWGHVRAPHPEDADRPAEARWARSARFEVGASSSVRCAVALAAAVAAAIAHVILGLGGAAATSHGCQVGGAHVGQEVFSLRGKAGWAVVDSRCKRRIFVVVAGHEHVASRLHFLERYTGSKVAPLAMWQLTRMQEPGEECKVLYMYVSTIHVPVCCTPPRAVASGAVRDRL